MPAASGAWREGGSAAELLTASDPATWFGDARAYPSGAEAHPHVALVPDHAGWVAKRMTRTGLAGWCEERGLSTGRAHRSYERLVLLGRRGAGALGPEPVGWLEARGAPVSILITQLVDGVSFWEAHERQGVALLEAMGRAIARLHAAGCAHRDLKAPNWRIAPEGPRWVDAEGLQVGAPALETRIRDLARLRASWEVRHEAGVGFEPLLSAYLSTAGATDPRTLAEFDRATARRAELKRRRNARRKQPLA